MFDINIITGMSGAGKTFANKCFEDMGFYCVDNLPPALIPHFAELCSNSKKIIDKVSLVIDIRGGEFFDDLFNALDALDQKSYRYSIVFLDAADSVLIRRYKETRRQHPLSGPEESTTDGIRAEREKLKRLKDRADYYIDTTAMNPWELKKEITRLVLGDEKSKKLDITIITFGFKHGLPMEADLVFDVRFLPNPYYYENLKELSGENAEVYDFVINCSETTGFISRAANLLTYMIPLTINEGRSNLVIAIGCTGGHHRSVVLGIEFCRILTQTGYSVNVKHRDISVGG